MNIETVEIIECEQGSAEWHGYRAGVVTASNAEEVQKVKDGLTDQQQTYVTALLSGKSESEAKTLAGYRAKPTTDKVTKALDGETVGDWTDVAKAYAFTLAVERISGEPLDEGYTGWAANRGHELEPDARALHGFIYGLEIEKAGFVRTTDGKFGASADGLVGKDGGAEYKCFINPDKLRAIIIERDIKPYIAQCQAGMWLTGRNWWHFGLYCPALEKAGKALTVIPVKRDDEYIDRMESTLLRFDDLVESYRAELMTEHKLENAT